eukprot:6203411-Pleurochrysis_carterae.AAC.1
MARRRACAAAPSARRSRSRCGCRSARACTEAAPAQPDGERRGREGGRGSERERGREGGRERESKCTAERSQPELSWLVANNDNSLAPAQQQALCVWFVRWYVRSSRLHRDILEQRDIPQLPLQLRSQWNHRRQVAVIGGFRQKAAYHMPSFCMPIFGGCRLSSTRVKPRALKNAHDIQASRATKARASTTSSCPVAVQGARSEM